MHLSTQEFFANAFEQQMRDGAAFLGGWGLEALMNRYDLIVRLFGRCPSALRCSWTSGILLTPKILMLLFDCSGNATSSGLASKDTGQARSPFLVKFTDAPRMSANVDGDR